MNAWIITAERVDSEDDVSAITRRISEKDPDEHEGEPYLFAVGIADVMMAAMAKGPCGEHWLPTALANVMECLGKKVCCEARQMLREWKAEEREAMREYKAEVAESQG